MSKLVILATQRNFSYKVRHLHMIKVHMNTTLRNYYLMSLTPVPLMCGH